MKRHLAFIVGTLALWSTPSFAQNLVQNPGFETGTFADWTATIANIDPIFTHSGSFATSLNIGGSISQALATTPGDSYHIEFWLALSGASSPVTFSASWDGTTVFTINPLHPFNYKEEIIADVTASTSSTILDFSQEIAPGSYNLDDVSVTDVTPAGVPDGGSTLWLLSLGVAVTATLTRKRAQA